MRPDPFGLKGLPKIPDEAANSCNPRQRVRSHEEYAANSIAYREFSPQPGFAHGGPSDGDDLTGRAGTPATIAPGGTSRVTTEPAPTIAFLPIVTPGRMTQ